MNDSRYAPIAEAAELRARVRLSNILREEVSVEIGPEREMLWDSRVAPLLRQAGLPDLATLAQQIADGDRQLLEGLVDAMTTNETLFFRDRALFEELLTSLIPEMAARADADPRTEGRVITIWSAASSSGQEIYSTAILLKEMFPHLLQENRVQLLASDVSQAMVDRCREAKFSALEMDRGMPAEYRDRYFTPTADGEWQLDRGVRRLVRTQVVNLMRPLDSIPKCDIVLLRNVLIYFNDRDRMSLLKRIHGEVLRPDGAMVLGASEMIGKAEHLFKAKRLERAVCFRPRHHAPAG